MRYLPNVNNENDEKQELQMKTPRSPLACSLAIIMMQEKASLLGFEFATFHSYDTLAVHHKPF